MALQFFPNFESDTIRMRSSYNSDTDDYYKDISKSALLEAIANSGLKMVVLGYYYFGYAVHYTSVNNETLYIADSSYVGSAGSVSFNKPTTFSTHYRWQASNDALEVETGYSHNPEDGGTVDGIVYKREPKQNDQQSYVIYDDEYFEAVAINGQLPVSYNWESIPRITGKDGKVFRLTDILNINNGEPVNDVIIKNNLDFSRKTKVNTLIDSVVPVVENVTKAIVSFDIPTSNYGYIKLVYKKDDIPTSVEDGKVKELDVDDDTVTVTGLEELTTYYFMIFTNKSESEPYKYKTGAKEVGIFKEDIIIIKGGVDNDFIDVVTVTKVT